MATVYVSEFANWANIGTRHVNVAPMPPLVEQSVQITAASVQSSPFSATTQIIRVAADAICSIAIGANPVATAAKMRISANAQEYFAVQPGHIIAVITNT